MQAAVAAAVPVPAPTGLAQGSAAQNLPKKPKLAPCEFHTSSRKKLMHQGAFAKPRVVIKRHIFFDHDPSKVSRGEPFMV